MKTLLLAASLALASFAASAATYDFSFNDGSTVTSGSFVTDALGDVTSITGSYHDANVNGTFTGVVALGTDAGFSYDNKFDPVNGFTNDGALFSLSDSRNVNFYAASPGEFSTVTYVNAGDVPGSAYTVTEGVPFAKAVSAVPENSPLTLTLLGLGFLAGVSFLAKRAKSTIIPAAPSFA
jgi:hypothetical protein